MEKENSFLASLQQEGRIDPPAEPQEVEKETPPAPPTEDKPEAEKADSPTEADGEKGSDAEKKEPNNESDKPGEQEEKLPPFHQHPRWIALQDELSELRDFREKVSPLLDRLGENKQEEENAEIPDWFKELFGENDGAWNKYRAYDKEQRKQLRVEIMQEIQSQNEQTKKESEKWDKWVDSEITKLETKGLKFNRNELLKVALDYSPTDDTGQISLQKAYDILQVVNAQKPNPKPAATEEKKKIADQTMSKGKREEEKATFKTSNDLRHKSFTDFIPRE